ncbi:MAG: 50S ribosomal protein L6 [Phycisphaerae bacterium]|nr:50S ribosomal protein L6 [Phycisphaerae bacterium]
MSRIGKKPVSIPAGVKVEISGQIVKVSGSKGSLEINCRPEVKVKLDGQKVIVESLDAQSRIGKAMHGTTRALINNMVIGVTNGYEKKLEIYGTGYSVKEQGGTLTVQVGFSHPVEIKVPKSVKVKVEVPATKGNDTPAKFTLMGYDKHELGQFAANVRKIRPPEPYQGKGIRFADEHVRRKVGKALAGTTAA